MNRLTAIGLASLAAYGLLIASKYAGFVPGLAVDKPPRALASAEPREAPVSAVLPVTPEPNPRPVSLPAPVARAQPAALSPTALEFRAARDLKAFADALAARKGSLSGDERYYLARALEECQFVTSINEDLAAYSAKQRRQFLSGLPAGDPLNTKRIAAYEAADNTQRCLRFQNAKFSPKDIEDLYQAAAAQGDPRAQARIVVAELGKGTANTVRNDNASTAPRNDNEFSRLIGLLETRDPEAMLIVGQYLSQSANVSQLRIGPNGEVPEPSAFLGAFSLVACDLGPDCVTLSREPQLACAYAGYCTSTNYEELYQNFLASPWVYSQAIRYRSIILNAIETRNWALLGLVPPSSAPNQGPQ